MKKMLKIIAMLLVIATVVFAAGCADKGTEAPEDGASEEVTDENVVAAPGDVPEGEVGAEVPPENLTDDEDLVADDDLAVDEEVADEDAADEDAVDEDAADEDAVDEDAADEDAADEDAADEDAADEDADTADENETIVE